MRAVYYTQTVRHSSDTLSESLPMPNRPKTHQPFARAKAAGVRQHQPADARPNSSERGYGTALASLPSHLPRGLSALCRAGLQRPRY